MKPENTAMDEQRPGDAGITKRDVAATDEVAEDDKVIKRTFLFVN